MELRVNLVRVQLQFDRLAIFVDQKCSFPVVVPLTCINVHNLFDAFLLAAQELAELEEDVNLTVFALFVHEEAVDGQFLCFHAHN